MAPRADHGIHATDHRRERRCPDAPNSNAVGYVLKPLSPEHVDLAVDRCLAAPRPLLALRRVLEGIARACPARVFVRDRRHPAMLSARTVDYVAAEGDYVRVHSGGRSHLVEVSLAEMDASTALWSPLSSSRQTTVTFCPGFRLDRLA
jgi:DNA-binding LytR/AlgR family response regulator